MSESPVEAAFARALSADDAPQAPSLGPVDVVYPPAALPPLDGLPDDAPEAER